MSYARRRWVMFYVHNLLILLPHLLSLLCGVDVSNDTPLFNLILRFLPWQFSLRQVVPDVIQPSPLRSSSRSFPRHLRRHHSLAHVFFFSSQYMPILRQPTFSHFLGHFSHLRCPSNYFIPYSIQVGDSTHPSEHSNFCHIQYPTSSLVLSSLPTSRDRTPLLQIGAKQNRTDVTTYHRRDNKNEVLLYRFLFAPRHKFRLFRSNAWILYRKEQQASRLQIIIKKNSQWLNKVGNIYLLTVISQILEYIFVQVVIIIGKT